MGTPIPDPAQLLAELLDLNVDDLDAAGVRAAMGRHRLVESAVHRLDAALRARARELTPAPNPSPIGPTPSPSPVRPTGGIAPETLDGIAGIASPEGRRRDSRSLLIERFPELGDALTRGLCSTDHLDVIAGAISRASVEIVARLGAHRSEILSNAMALTPSQLRRWCDRLLTRIAAELGVAREAQRKAATRLRHWLDRDTGMGHLHGTFDPDTYHRLTALLDAETGRRMKRDRDQNRDHVMAHALVDLVAGTSDSPEGSPAVTVIIDADTLIHGAHANTVCERPDGTAVDIDTAREAACTSDIVPVFVTGGTVPIAVGRTRRLATIAQRRAIEAIHSSCAIPGCEVSITRCEVHHLIEWEQGGCTDLDNLIPVCSHHHHRVHADGWQLTLARDRTLTVTRPDGSAVSDSPDRLPRAG
jgi:hypothetical protein